MGEGARIYEFPVLTQKRTCAECQHAALHVSGVYCVLFQEAIWNELVAEDCEEFERGDA